MYFENKKIVTKNSDEKQIFKLFTYMYNNKAY